MAYMFTLYKWTEDNIYRVALAAMLCDMDNMISAPFVIVVLRCRLSGYNTCFGCNMKDKEKRIHVIKTAKRLEMSLPSNTTSLVMPMYAEKSS